MQTHSVNAWLVAGQCKTNEIKMNELRYPRIQPGIWGWENILRQKRRRNHFKLNVHFKREKEKVKQKNATKSERLILYALSESKQ